MITVSFSTVQLGEKKHPNHARRRWLRTKFLTARPALELSSLIISNIRATQIALNSRVTSVNGRTELRNISAMSAETEIVETARLFIERARAREKERKVHERSSLQFLTPCPGQFTHGENYDSIQTRIL